MGAVGITKAERARAERAEREAAWEAEQARVRALGDLFTALPEGHQKAALLDAMTDRVIQLYNEVKHEQGDAILEFMPNDHARDLLDWYFDEDGPDTFTPKAATADYEITQPGQVQGGAQQPGGTDGQCSIEAHAEIIDLTKDLVALWQSPKIQGLPRADRNTAIEETRNKMIAVVSAVSNGER
jgi:hypothetical protein